MRELLLLLFGQYVRPTGGPHAYEVIHELPACQSVLLQEQFDHALALLLNLFVSFAHNAVEFYDLRVQGRCKPNAMERVPIAEAQPVGFALVRRDSANHASMLALAASSVLAAFGCKGTKYSANKIQFPRKINKSLRKRAESRADILGLGFCPCVSSTFLYPTDRIWLLAVCRMSVLPLLQGLPIQKQMTQQFRSITYNRSYILF